MEKSQKRYEEIVEERYLLAKNCSIAYSDTENIPPAERKILMTLFMKDLERMKKKQDEMMSKQQAKPSGKRR